MSADPPGIMALRAYYSMLEDEFDEMDEDYREGNSSDEEEDDNDEVRHLGCGGPARV